MNSSRIIKSLVALGNSLSRENNSELALIKEEASARNRWFDISNITLAFKGINEFLKKENLHLWLHDRPFNSTTRTIGLVMAGNIPMVGFHDLICVLATGNKAKVKLSSDDNILIPFLVNQLFDIDPDLKERIFFVDILKDIDAVIATGSDNSSRYFEYYFKNIPHIIRKNRTSVAILTGEENKEDLLHLGNDILQYFGLGCRNVSKLFVPDQYDFSSFYEAIQPLHDVIYMSKYVNNYDYNKSIYLVNREDFKDNGFLLLKPDQAFVSPLSVVYYEHYQSEHDLIEKLKMNESKVQVTVSKEAFFANSLAFGDSQKPNLWDYADNVDTVEFLIGLN